MVYRARALPQRIRSAGSISVALRCSRPCEPERDRAHFWPSPQDVSVLCDRSEGDHARGRSGRSVLRPCRRQAAACRRIRGRSRESVGVRVDPHEPFAPSRSRSRGNRIRLEGWQPASDHVNARASRLKVSSRSCPSVGLSPARRGIRSGTDGAEIGPRSLLALDDSQNAGRVSASPATHALQGTAIRAQSSSWLARAEVRPPLLEA